MNPILHRLTEGTFIELLDFEDLRGELLAFLRRPWAEVRASWALLEVVAMRCQATPEQLRAGIAALEGDGSRQAEDTLAALLFHPDIPEDVLLRLAREGRFVTVLGHRRGPQPLLEVLAEQHRQAEAITTLALSYLGGRDAPAEPFGRFIRRFADVAMLEINVRDAELDPRKRAIVDEVFGAAPRPRRRR